METEDQDTPRKLKTWSNCMGTYTRTTTAVGFTTPQTKIKSESIYQISQTRITPNDSKITQNEGAMYMQPMTTSMISTPPAKRFQQKVRNPFEAALTDRLHLPLIESPSLFQRPTTPQLSSTQFEWTIEEVSGLQPANVEVHETQFHDSPDPEYEAKAQMAISTYFKEQQIVPSPVDCPLRNNRIIFSELNANTPISKPGRRIRDFGTQTDLTLPFVLPKELEEALKPYFQPELAGVGREWKGRGYRSSNSNNENVKDVSLRRKLFDMNNVVLVSDGEVSLVNKTSNSNDRDKSSSPLPGIFNGKLSDSMDKSTCGSLSPISTKECLSFSSPSPAQSSPTKRKIGLRDFELSPILPPQRKSKIIKNKIITERRNFRLEKENNEENTSNEMTQMESSKFSPDRSSSPLISLTSNVGKHIGNCSSDSFNVRISRLAVTNPKSVKTNTSKSRMETHLEVELFMSEETDLLDEDDDDMQVSQLSMHSSNCSSNSDTPRHKRRSASRKNLSQSFSASWLQADDDDDLETKPINAAPKVLLTKCQTSLNGDDFPLQQTNIQETLHNKLGADNQKVNFYRTDSGFNEMTTSSSVMSSQDEHSRDTGSNIASGAFHDVSMISCETI